MDHKNYLSNNMSLNQLMKITGSVSLITMLAFSQRGILQAEETVVPTTNRINLEPVNIDYNDTASIAKMSKTILKENVNLLSELQLIESSQNKDVYSLEDYIVSVYYQKDSGLGIKDVKLTIETKFTHSRPEAQKIVLINEQNRNAIQDGNVYVYNVKVNVKDNVAPEIWLENSSYTIKDTDTFSFDDKISVTDNVDGKLDYTLDGDFEVSGDKYKAGTYTFTVNTADFSGNSSTAEIRVTVEETKPVVSKNYYSSKNTDTSNYKGADAVVSAAYAQLGKRQDCTMLVTNSLAAAGIYFHGWPREYFALGYQVSSSQARPGDLIYYDNGGTGKPHIAIYIGNGKAIHGGWQGSTKIAPAYTGSGPVFIRITK